MIIQFQIIKKPENSSNTQQKNVLTIPHNDEHKLTWNMLNKEKVLLMECWSLQHIYDTKAIKHFAEYKHIKIDGSPLWGHGVFQPSLHNV